MFFGFAAFRVGDVIDCGNACDNCRWCEGERIPTGSGNEVEAVGDADMSRGEVNEEPDIGDNTRGSGWRVEWGWVSSLGESGAWETGVVGFGAVDCLGFCDQLVDENPTAPWAVIEIGEDI